MERTYTTAGVQLVQSTELTMQLMMTHYLFLASRDNEIMYLILNILAAYTSLTWKGSTSFC